MNGAVEPVPKRCDFGMVNRTGEDDPTRCNQIRAFTQTFEVRVSTAPLTTHEHTHNIVAFPAHVRNRVDHVFMALQPFELPQIAFRWIGVVDVPNDFLVIADTIALQK